MEATMLQTSAQGFRSTANSGKKGERLSDDEAALLIHVGYAFDALLILVGLIAVAAGQLAGGLGVAGLGMTALLAGRAVVGISDRFRR
jgi:hypothetical protein